MKVDANGNSVTEGTYGLVNGYTARVTRTFVSPIEDDKKAVKIISEGGYQVEFGKVIPAKAIPAHQFVTDPEPNVVRAQDGQTIEPGDWVVIVGKGKTEYEVKNVYSTDKLQGACCLTLKDMKGSGPDGHYVVIHGMVESVRKTKTGKDKGSELSRPTLTMSSPSINTDLARVGDVVYFLRDDEKIILRGTVIHDKNYDENDRLEVVLDEASEALTGSSRYTIGDDNLLRVSIVTKYVAEVMEGDLVILSYSGCSDRMIWHVLGRARKTDDNVTLIVLVPYNKEAAAFVEEHKEALKTVEELTLSDGLQIQGFCFHETYVRKVIGHESFLDETRGAGRAGIAYAGAYPRPETDSEMMDSKIKEAIFKGKGYTLGKGEEKENMAKTEKSTKLEIVREGTRIIVPETMSTRAVIKELERQAQQEELDVNIMEMIEGFPLDAAHALVQFLGRKYGWVNALPTPGFFGPTPPTMVGVTVDPDGNTVQIPWGKLGIPGLSGALQTGILFQDGRPVFCLQGTVKQKDKALVNEIAQGTREYLKFNSIYKGKAIRVQFPDPEEPNFSPIDHQPKFMQTSDVKPDELIFSRDVEKQVAINIWTPIRSLEAVKAARVPLKRGVLLHGRYGCGKTLLASVTARMTVQSGSTFMDLVDSKQLPQAIQFARMLGGMVVIFAEDIDRCDENGSRNNAFNEILNTVDGLTSKSDEILIVYTTNHIERISKAMLRQGRIDKVIHIKEPDAEAAQRLVRLYARHLLAPSEDLSNVGMLLSGFIPAAIREVVEQSKLSAIERGDVHKITAEDLQVTAENTREHMELLRETPVDSRSELERAATAVGREIAKALDTKLGAEGWGDSPDGGKSSESILANEITAPVKRTKVAA